MTKRKPDSTLSHFPSGTVGWLMHNVAMIPEAGCWIWLGSINKYGYGQFNSTRNRFRQMHRVAWRLLRGDPGDLFVLHKCDVRLCVNPDHLFLGTHDDNMEDMVKKGRQDHGENPCCPRGHLKSEHRIRGPNGVKYCRECSRETSREWKLRTCYKTPPKRRMDVMVGNVAKDELPPGCDGCREDVAGNEICTCKERDNG